MGRKIFCSQKEALSISSRDTKDKISITKGLYYILLFAACLHLPSSEQVIFTHGDFSPPKPRRQSVNYPSLCEIIKTLIENLSAL